MLESEFVCYIDEAGCSGGKFNTGSSRYLAMGAVVWRRSNESNIMEVFSEVRQERGHQNGIKKFSKANNKDNFVLTKLLASKPIQVVAVAFDKPELKNADLRASHETEYNYLLKFVLERVSWLVRDAKPEGYHNSKVDIIMSSQSMYPTSGAINYCARLAKNPRKFNCNAEWDYIGLIDDTPHVNETPVHLSDTIASAFHLAIEPKMHDMTDERFFQNFANRIYRRNGNPYGVKIFPKEAVSRDMMQGRLRFLSQM